jgi:hypothetical protein
MIQAAKLLGVPPWELTKQPIIWQTWAFEAAEAQAYAAEELDKHRKANPQPQSALYR